MTGRREILVWWSHVIAEVIFLYGIIVLTELALAGGRIGSFRVHPHPYWLVVIPLAAARGVVAALLSAAVASTLYVFGAQEAYPTETLHDLLTLDIMLEPILFFGVGFLIGEFRDVVTERLRRRERSLAESAAFGERMKAQRDVLQEANRILEKRLVNQATQFGNLIVAARRIEEAGRAELFEIALEMIEDHCGAQASILLPLPDGRVDYLAHRGWPEKEISERLAAAQESEFVHAALAEGREMNGFAVDHAPPDSGPLAVAPLLGRGGVIDALLCLDAIPASRLNTSSIRTFFSVAEWISAALDRMSGTSVPAGGEPEDPPMEPSSRWLGSPDDLARHLLVEYDRSSRYGVPVSVLAIQIADLPDTSLASVAQADRMVRETFIEGTRGSDAFFRFPHPGCYVMILPGTPLEGAETVAEKLLDRLPEEPEIPDVPFTDVRILATGPDPEAPDAASFVRRLSDCFREVSTIPVGVKCPLALPSRARVRGLSDFFRRLNAEIALATRHSLPMQVLEVAAMEETDAEPGLLALHVERVLDGALRRSDCAFSIGAGHVAIILPHTETEEAEAIGQRLLGTISARDPGAAYGEVAGRALALGHDCPDAAAFLSVLGEMRPLNNVRVTGDAS